MKKDKLKKYGIALISFCFMLAVAGYINYKYNPEREKDLGQTVYVSSNNDDVDIYKEVSQEDNTLSSFRYDRDNMYSELENNYTSIINNSNSSSDTIKEYQKKLSDLIEQKNQITMVENVIKSKYVEDVVIIPTTSGKINIIVKTENLDESLTAKIMQQVVDQLNVSANDISIEASK